MPPLAISSTSMSAFQKFGDEQFVTEVVAWSKDQIARVLDTNVDEVLIERARRTLVFGRRHGLVEQQDLALLFGVLHMQGVGLAANAGFRESLLRLAPTERRSLLYDLLTGLVSPGRGAITPHWNVALG